VPGLTSYSCPIQCSVPSYRCERKEGQVRKEQEALVRWLCQRSSVCWKAAPEQSQPSSSWQEREGSCSHEASSHARFGEGMAPRAGSGTIKHRTENQIESGRLTMVAPRTLLFDMENSLSVCVRVCESFTLGFVKRATRKCAVTRVCAGALMPAPRSCMCETCHAQVCCDPRVRSSF
jgi:hypothetical protein